jgi:hypothetical protein
MRVKYRHGFRFLVIEFVLAALGLASAQTLEITPPACSRGWIRKHPRDRFATQ